MLVGTLVIVASVVLAALAPALAPADPIRNDLLARLAPPMWMEGGSARHPLGTDTLGRDVVSRLLYGARVSLLVGFAAVLVAGVVGVALGLVAGYYGGRLDDLLMRVGDVQLAFPVLVLAIAVLSVLGASLGNVIIVLGLTGWVTYARITRAETLSLRHRDFVEGARALGARDAAILWRHILPNVLAADHGGGDLLGGADDHRRGVAVVPGTRHPAARAQLGRDAGRRTELPDDRLVARAVPRPGDPGPGAGDQPGGRLAARRARSARRARDVSGVASP